jgi:hypothetical protein
MVCFQAKNPNLGKFWRALNRMENAGKFYGHLEYLTVIWCIFGHMYLLKCCGHLVLFFTRFGMLFSKQSGNHVKDSGRNREKKKVF